VLPSIELGRRFIRLGGVRSEKKVEKYFGLEKIVETDWLLSKKKTKKLLFQNFEYD